MDWRGNLILTLVGPVPDQPVGRVAGFASAEGESILWSGAAISGDALRAGLESDGGYLAIGITVALALASIAVVRIARGKGEAWTPAIFSLMALSLLGIPISNANTLARDGGTAYVVTDRRIVRLWGATGRVDRPATDVAAITRGGNWTTIAFRSSSPVSIVEEDVDGAGLDRAMERFAEASFQPADALRDAIGRP